MFVPQGKKVRLYADGVPYLSVRNLNAHGLGRKYPDYVEIPMYLGEDLSLKTSSEFTQPFQSMQESLTTAGMKLQAIAGGVRIIGENTGDNAISNALTRASKNFENTSLQSRYTSFQIWKYSNPIVFSFNINFFVGIDGYHDAKLEVFFPTLRLMELVLPTERTEMGFTRLDAPGPTMTSLMGEVMRGNEHTADRAVLGRSYSLNIGNIVKLDSIIIKDVETTFSKELDINGYPMSSTVSFQVETTTVATANMIQNMATTTDNERINQALDDIASNTEEIRKQNLAVWADKLLR